MPVSAIGAVNTDQPALFALQQQRSRDFASLESEVQSGNISAAQAALVAFQQDEANIDSGSGSQSSQSTQPLTTFRSDFASLVSAVQSGDIAGAQSALKSLEADRPSAAGYGGQPGSAENGLDSLLQAVQSGNLAEAQTALAALQTGTQSPGSGVSETGSPTATVAAVSAAPGHQRHHAGGGHGGYRANSGTSTSSSSP